MKSPSRLNAGYARRLRLEALLRFLVVGVAMTAAVEHTAAADPDINQRFPIKEPTSLSPPQVVPPIHECATAVAVTGFVPGAIVHVYSGSTEIGHGTFKVGFGTVKLGAPIAIRDSITATQSVGAVTSGHSYDPVIVTKYPVLTTPVVSKELYECGGVVSVSNLVASTQVNVTDNDIMPPPLIGAGPSTGDWLPVATSPLVKGHHPIAQQVQCPTGSTVSSPPSDGKERVLPDPSPMPAPSVDASTVVKGNTVVTLHQLLVGATVTVKVGATVIGGGLATAADDLCPVSPIPSGAGVVTATQTLCTSSPASPGVPVINNLDAPLLGGPICAGGHYVTVLSSTPNANVVLMRGTSVIGYGGAVMGVLKLAVGAGITLHAGDALTVVQYIGSVISPPSNTLIVGCDGGGNVVTQHNDNARTGVYSHETVLTPAQVAARGMVVKYTFQVAAPIVGQPLYVDQVDFRKGGFGSAGLFVTDMQNNVYALDANTGFPKWVTTLADTDPARRFPKGIDATPVIDVPNNRMYVVFSTLNTSGDLSKPAPEEGPWVAGLNAAFWLAVLDIRDGRLIEKRKIDATLYRQNGAPVVFDARLQRNHAALLLNQGSVYVAFCSIAPAEWTEYHGWVMAYNASNLAFEDAWCPSKNYFVPPPYSGFGFSGQSGAGIWEGGGGLSADPDGNVYFLTGNGKVDIANDWYGDCFVKLIQTGASLVSQVYVPPDTKEMLNNDADLGSGGTLVVPGTHLVVGGGKPGYLYLLDRATMNPVQGQFDGATNQSTPSDRDNTWNLGPHLHGSPTYWRGADPKYGFLYVWGEKDYLQQYKFDASSNVLIQSPATHGPVLAVQNSLDSKGNAVFVMPGGMVSLSSNGNNAHSGVVWATLPESQQALGTPAYVGHLYAFDAETLEALWDTEFPSMGHWLEPTIAAGKVFVGTSSDVLICYALGAPNVFRNSPYQPFQPTQPRQGTDRGDMLRSMARRDRDESMMFSPRTAFEAVSPYGAEQVGVIEGDGTLAYKAVQSASGLVWSSRASDVTGRFTPHRALAPASGQVHVLRRSDREWVVGDSRAVTVRIRAHAAPENGSSEWVSYRVTSGTGLFKGVGHIVSAFTEGGVPRRPPRRAGETDTERYHVQFILYKPASREPSSAEFR